MQANIETRSLFIVLLDSVGKYTRIGDANRLRRWLEATKALASIASDAMNSSETPTRRSASAPNPRPAYDSGSENGSRVSVQYPSQQNIW
jgi:D-alanyl-D-alanine carboxypeptidase